MLEVQAFNFCVSLDSCVIIKLVCDGLRAKFICKTVRVCTGEFFFWVGRYLVECNYGNASILWLHI